MVARLVEPERERERAPQEGQRLGHGGGCARRIARALVREGHLRRAIDSYLAHYNAERNHQGLGNELIDGAKMTGNGDVVCDKRLGGLLKYYRRVA